MLKYNSNSKHVSINYCVGGLLMKLQNYYYLLSASDKAETENLNNCNRIPQLFEFSSGDITGFAPWRLVLYS